MHTGLRWLRRKPLALLLLGLLALGGGLWASSGSTADAAKTVSAYAGAGRDGFAVNLFLPDEIYVEAGDTVEWVNPYIEPHTITYLRGTDSFPEFEAPANVEAAAAFDGSESLTSGFIVKDGHFPVTFSKLGKYTFLCLIHGGMIVDVYVLPPGATVPPQGANDPVNIAKTESAIAQAEAAVAALQVPGATSNADGSKSWTVLTGPALPLDGGNVDVMKFYAPNLNVAVGDTVTWEDTTFTPHTVTFIPQDNLPEAIDPFTPDIPGMEYDGSEYVNSGLIGDLPPFLGGPNTSFSLTFTRAGAYEYVCLLHADQGMVGTIVVGSGAGTGGITPPSTGDGGLAD
jgi:plastocyanin